MYKSHFSYSEITGKIKCVLYVGHTKREGNIWHNLRGNSIDPAIITKSFKKCYIINDLDGTEDDVLWAEEYDKSDTDSNDTRTDTSDVQLRE